MLSRTISGSGSFEQLLVVRLLIGEVVVVRLTVLHLVLGLVGVHLHHAVVLLILVDHVIFVHACRDIVRVHKLLLLLQEHVHRWRG